MIKETLMHITGLGWTIRSFQVRIPCGKVGEPSGYIVEEVRLSASHWIPFGDSTGI